MIVLELIHGIIQAALILFLAVAVILCWVLYVTRNHRYDGQADRLDHLDGACTCEDGDCLRCAATRGTRAGDDEDYAHWGIR